MVGVTCILYSVGDLYIRLFVPSPATTVWICMEFVKKYTVAGYNSPSHPEI